MRKEDLIKLGLTDELAEAVAQASAEELKGYIPLSRFQEVNEAKKHAEDSVKDRDKQIEGLKASAGDAEKLKEQIEQLQADNKRKDSDHATEIRKLKVENAVDAALTGAKAKNLKAVKALLDLSKAELAEDGTVKGLADQIKALQESDSFMFDIGKPMMKGARTGDDGIEGGDGKPDLSTMSYSELCQYLAENPDAKLE